MVSTFILGALVGLLLGLAWCYWKQIRAVYEKKDIISSGATLVGAAGDFWDNFRKV